MKLLSLPWCHSTNKPPWASYPSVLPRYLQKKCYVGYYYNQACISDEYTLARIFLYTLCTQLLHLTIGFRLGGLIWGMSEPCPSPTEMKNVSTIFLISPSLLLLINMRLEQQSMKESYLIASSIKNSYLNNTRT